jgi:hypothetical protein
MVSVLASSVVGSGSDLLKTNKHQWYNGICFEEIFSHYTYNSLKRYFYYFYFIFCIKAVIHIEYRPENKTMCHVFCLYWYGSHSQQLILEHP